MSSLCHNIKQEYEALRALKEKFVLACDSAGNVDALSKEDLKKLKRLKLELEQARNTLKNKIESESMRIWKGVLIAANAAVIESGPYEGMSVYDLVHSKSFKKMFLKNLSNEAEDGRIGSEHSVNVVVGFHAASGLQLFSKDESWEVQRIMEMWSFRRTLSNYISSKIEEGINGDDDQSSANAAVGFFKARELGLFPDDFSKVGIQEQFKTEFFLREINNHCIRLLTEEDRSQDNFDTYSLTILHSELELDLLNDNSMRELQHYIQSEAAQQSIVKNIVRNAQMGFDEYQNRWSVVSSLFAIKSMVDFYRKHPRF